MFYAYRTRVFAIDADDVIYPIPASRYDRAYRDGMALPQFALRRLRFAELAIRVDRNGLPTGHVSSWYKWQLFDGCGRLDQNWLDEERRLTVSPLDRLSQLHRGLCRSEPQRTKFHHPRFLSEHSWSPTEQLRQQLIRMSLSDVRTKGLSRRRVVRLCTWVRQRQ